MSTDMSDLEDLITRDETLGQVPPPPPSGGESYEHTATLDEVRAAYVAQHSQAVYDAPGPRPQGVPQGPDHAHAEFVRLLRSLTEEQVEAYLTDLDRRYPEEESA